MSKILITKEDLEASYNLLKSYSAVGKKFNLPKTTIQYYMNKYNISRKKNKNICDEDFFSRDNELSYYWAGFIAADGCVYEYKSYKRLRICLSIIDENHLIKFKNDIKTSANITYHNNIDKKYCNIEISSFKIVKDLERFNVIPRKSLVYKFPENIDYTLINHFMRGYNDGDGCFCTLSRNENTKREQLRFSLRGTFIFLDKYSDILVENCNLTKNKIQKGKIYTLQYGGNGVCKNIGNFLYSNSTVYLTRKFNIWNSLNEK